MTPRHILFLLTLPLLSSATLSAQQAFPVSKVDRMDASSLAPLPANGVVPLKVIAGDFAANQQGAVGKYSGQRITVVGRIAALSNPSSENKVLSVTLQDATGNLPAVKAEFLYGSIPQNSEIQVSPDGAQATLVRRDRSGNILSQDTYLSVGQKVAIKGDFKELKVGDIVLTACKLTRKP
jgi:tRNA_anti-like